MYELSVHIQHPGCFDSSIDRKIESVVGRNRYASGMDLMSKVRDLEFKFARKSAALAASKRVRKLVFSGKRVSASVRRAPWLEDKR